MVKSEKPLAPEELYRQIRRRILKLELEPGLKISENQMSEEYGVSRSMIRTVFTRLNQLKLVEIFPQRGTYVSLIDLDHIRDLLMLRTAVEKEIIFEMFEQVSGEEWNALIIKLEENLAKQEQYRNLLSYEKEFSKLDSEFHRTMIDSVQRFSVVELLSDQMLHIARWRNFDVSFDKRIPELIAEHRSIYTGIKNRKLSEAHAAMARHLETISGINERAKAKYPQYFK